MARNKGFMLFDIAQAIDPFTGRPTDTTISNYSIGTAKSFSNLGTQTQIIAGIPLDTATDKIKIMATKYKMQKNCLTQDINGDWQLWSVLKPEDVVPKNQNLVNLVLQSRTNGEILEKALILYNTERGV